MPKISNYETTEFIKSLAPFSNKTGKFYSTLDSSGYKIWSYYTCLAQYSDGVWYLNNRGYSMVTGRHQYFIRKALRELGVDTINNAINFEKLPYGVLDLEYIALKRGPIMASRIERIKKGK